MFSQKKQSKWSWPNKPQSLNCMQNAKFANPRFYYQNSFHKSVKCSKQGCNFEWRRCLDKLHDIACDCELDVYKIFNVKMFYS